MNKETTSHIQILLNEDVENSFVALQRSIRQSSEKYPEHDVKVNNSLGTYIKALKAKEEFDEYVDEMTALEDKE